MFSTDKLTYGAPRQTLLTTFSPSGDFTAGMHDSVNTINMSLVLYCVHVTYIVVFIIFSATHFDSARQPPPLRRSPESITTGMCHDVIVYNVTDLPTLMV